MYFSYNISKTIYNFDIQDYIKYVLNINLFTNFLIIKKLFLINL